ncbi:macrophage mannose receptor 1-like [Uloborus diversus]|uniref:macrophage mannose receptor 1-like n=1 Tax=Uloborus diversus TaxID=327109 RepID=UPI002409A932|nr:macrophage mannose receptor 1-like [Uloborus diversus]
MAWITWCLVIGFHLGSIATLKNGIRPKPENIFEKIMSCDRGWYSFGNKCYKLGGNKKILSLHYGNGLKHCNDVGGTLAAITSKEILDFVSVFLILKAERGAWIGLSDIRSEGKFYWEDGSPVNYTNWARDEPSHDKHGNDEDCVEMQWYASPQIGEWNDIHCGVEAPFVCQKENVEMPLVKAPLDPRLCSEENNSGWKFRNSCYNLLRERRSWEDAENVCKHQYKGHLVTIRDVTYDMFLDYMLRDIKEDIWIGIKIKESYTQKWSSGWFVGYSGWKKKKKDFLEGTCATRSSLGKWGYESCTKKVAFVCESSTDVAPVLTSSVKRSVCPEEPDDWRDLGGDTCYFFETEIGTTWYKASFKCLQRGGNLVSIHSKEELDVLKQFVRYIKFESLMIGLHRDAADGNKFSWSDRSPVDFTNWDEGEPNSDMEHCSVAYTTSMKFHNHLCEEPRGYICAVRKTLPHAAATDDSLSKCTNCISTSTFAGVVVCILFIEGLLGVIWLYYFKPRRKEERKRKSSTEVTRQRTNSERYRMRPVKDMSIGRTPPASFDISESVDYEEMS